MAKRRGRPRAGEERLSRARILRTALALIDTHGVESVSMRRLADALGVDPMAIYHHVPGKEAVLAGCVELAFEEMTPVPPSDSDWREQVRAFARAYREMVRRHPNLSLHLIANVQAGGARVLEATDRLCAALEKAGLAPRLVATAAAVIVDYVHGFALAEGLALQQGRRGVAGDGGMPALLAQHRDLPVPALRRAMAAGDGAADLERGIDLILAGIEAVGSSTAAEPPGRA